MSIHASTLGQCWMCNIRHNGYTVPMLLKHVENNEFGQVWKDENGTQYVVLEKLYRMEG